MFEGNPIGFQTQLGFVLPAFVHDKEGDRVSKERHYIGKRSPSIMSINANGEVRKDLDVLVLQTEKSSPFQLICQIHFEG